MLIDRHLVAELIDLSGIAGGSAADRQAHQDALETLLVRLYTGSTPAARQAFRTRLDPIPQDQKPWAAVLRPDPTQWIGLGPPVPAVLFLVLGQVDDDPDAAEDGNRLPDRDSMQGAPWAQLYAALDRWDTTAIQRHIGPTGWTALIERPVPLDQGAAVERMPARVVLSPPPMSPVMDPNPGPAPTPTSDTRAPAPMEAPAFWQNPVVIAGTVATVAVGSALAFSLARAPHPTPESV